MLGFQLIYSMIYLIDEVGTQLQAKVQYETSFTKKWKYNVHLYTMSQKQYE